MANFDRVNGPIDRQRTPIWEYTKIGPWFVIWYNDVSGRRFEEWTSIWVYHISLKFIWYSRACDLPNTGLLLTKKNEWAIVV